MCGSFMSCPCISFLLLTPVSYRTMKMVAKLRVSCRKWLHSVADKKNRSRIFSFFGDGLVEKESALSDLFTTNSIKTGKVEMKLFAGENHLSLLESEKVCKFI